MQKFLSIICICVGGTLLLYMIIVEDEPGAVPLIFLIVGTLWYLVIRSRDRRNKL